MGRRREMWWGGGEGCDGEEGRDVVGRDVLHNIDFWKDMLK